MLATAFFATSTAHADLQIDGFAEGAWSVTMDGFSSYEAHTVSGLLTKDCLFGMRTTSVSVQENFFNMPLNVQSGSGTFSVAPQGIRTDYTLRARYDTDGPGINMSHGDKIKIDLTASGSGSLVVVVGAIDAAGHQDTGSATYVQGGYVLIGKNQFSPFDWTHVKTFLVETGSDNGSRTISFDNIALVPEPTTLSAFALLTLYGIKQSRIRARSAGGPYLV